MKAFLPKNSTAAVLTNQFNVSRAGGLTETALLDSLTEVALKLDALPGSKVRLLAAYRELLVELEQHVNDVDAGES